MTNHGWTQTEEQRYMQAIKLASKNYASSGVNGCSGTQGPASVACAKGPNLGNLVMELDKFYPENGLITCSLFTFFWIREACSGPVYQFAEENGAPVFVYFSIKQDGFYCAHFSIDNTMEHFKVKLKKAE